MKIQNDLSNPEAGMDCVDDSSKHSDKHSDDEGKASYDHSDEDSSNEYSSDEFLFRRGKQTKRKATKLT